jgi:hypothetical protein
LIFEGGKKIIAFEARQEDLLIVEGRQEDALIFEERQEDALIFEERQEDVSQVIGLWLEEAKKIKLRNQRQRKARQYDSAGCVWMRLRRSKL